MVPVVVAAQGAGVGVVARDALDVEVGWIVPAAGVRRGARDAGAALAPDAGVVPVAPGVAAVQDAAVGQAQFWVVTGGMTTSGWGSRCCYWARVRCPDCVANRVTVG